MKKITSMLIIFLLLTYSSCVMAIQQIRWGSQGDPLNGLTITWRNDGSSDSIKWGYSNTYEKGQFLGVKRSGYQDNFYNFTFIKVKASATIHYKLYDSKTNKWTSAYSFYTAPPSDTTSFTFLGIGDSRSGLNIWKKISDLAQSKNANFTIYNGDIVENGGNSDQWNEWFNNANGYLQNNLLYHALGNHDAASVPTYKNIFTLPQMDNSEGLYYSFKYANCLFITLNSENPSDKKQYDWLVKTLKDNKDVTWKIISFHKPFYTIGAHVGEMDAYFNTWWKAFDDYGVDLIVTGHDHMYERTKPINRNISTKTPVANYGSGEGEGRCEITCGGAGAPLYTGTPNWSIQTYSSSYNFCKFTVNGNSLCDSTWDDNGKLIEAFCLTKSSPTGIQNEQKFNYINVYPNPVENSFTLSLQSPETGDGYFRVYDVNGKEVEMQPIHKSESKFSIDYNMSKHVKGVYYAEISVGSQRDRTLIVK